MSGWFEQLLLTALVLAVPATVSVFLGEPGRPRLRETYRAVLAAGLVAGIALAVGGLAGAGAWRTVLVAGVLGIVVLAFGPTGRAWTLRGLLAWSLTVTAGAAYLVDVPVWMAEERLGAADLVGGGALWLLEVFVLVLALGHVWELVDVLARWDWPRRTELDREVADTARRRGPFVSLHVPTHNEPPDLVIETLNRLVDLEYDDFEVLVIDNNTDDPELWRPVERFCRSHEKLGFFHLEDWPGHKSGALNFALEKVDPRTRIIGVVDADYQVDPDFLSRCVPLFDDEDLAFVQTPQDYRDWQVDPYFRRLYRSFSYFFDVSQRSRNERNGAIFGGTMGLISRDALVEVGGWDEWCITEDAELSLRLLRAGWSGTHVDHSFGRGVMPLTFEALKRQRFRWCFGGIQLLRLHWRSLLPGRRTESNELTLGQRWSFLSGGLQWFSDLAGVLFTGFLLLGALDVSTGDGFTVRSFTAPLLGTVLGLVLLGWLRSVALLRRAAHVGWRDAVGALGIRTGLAWVVALASIRGLVAREGAFLRTPEVRGEVGRRDALRGNVVEMLLAALCLVGALTAFAAAASGTAGGLVVGVLLLLQGSGYAAAPLNSLAAVNADLTPELRRRRREAMLSWTRVAPGVRRWGLGPALAAGMAAAGVVLLAGPVGAPVGDSSRGDGHDAAASPQRPRVRDAAPSQSIRSPLAPLSPLLSTAVAPPTSSPSVRQVAADRPGAAATRPSQAPTASPSTAPTSQPAPVKGHGRPTALPSKPTPTKKPH